MPQVTEYAPGWLVWVALNSPDIRVSRDFYNALFGWDTYTLTLAERDDVDIFTLGGTQGPEVAGLHALTDDTQPPSWTCYFRVEDVDTTVEVVKDAGGQVLLPPTDISDMGRSALCCDSQGADFALVRPYTFAGAGVFDEPSAMCWVELNCRDMEDARRFYHRVLGWRAVDCGDSRSGYTDFRLGENSVAGMNVMDRRWPSGKPPQWFPHFRVADCDATATRASELGAAITMGPTDIALGKLAVMFDPTGARVGIIAHSGDPGSIRRLPAVDIR